MTIPTTAKATTEIPANTPKPIGSTSNFFPGGSEVVGAPAPSAVGVEDRGKREDEGVGGRVLSGCGVAVGFDTEDVPYGKSEREYHKTITVWLTTTAGGTISLLVPVLLGADPPSQYRGPTRWARIIIRT